MSETQFEFRGLHTVQGYRVYIPGVIFTGNLEVWSEKSEKGVAVAGRISPMSITSTSFETDQVLQRPFDLAVYAYNALENRDYELEVLGVVLGDHIPFDYRPFIAAALIPWKPSRRADDYVQTSEKT